MWHFDFFSKFFFLQFFFLRFFFSNFFFLRFFFRFRLGIFFEIFFFSNFFFQIFFFRFFFLLVVSIVRWRLIGVSTYGLVARHTLTITYKVALTKNMKCGTQIFFRNLFVQIFFSHFFLLVFSLVTCKLIGVSIYGLLAGHTLAKRQKVALRKNLKCGTQIFFRNSFFNFFFQFFLLNVNIKQLFSHGYIAY